MNMNDNVARAEHRRELRTDYDYEKYARLDRDSEILRLRERARNLEAMAAHQNTQIDEEFLRTMAQAAREEATELEIEEARDA